VKALATWKWANFLGSLAPPQKRVVHINMDQTSVRLWMHPGAGYVVVPAGQRKRHLLEREQRAPLSKRRAAFSLMAFVSDDEVVQRLLPQIVLVNERTLTSSETAAVRASLATKPNDLLFRSKSAWSNADTLVHALRVLKHALEPVEPFAHCLFLVDCSPVHCTEKVCRAAARAGVHLHFVPGNMTGALQPLDVYVFSQFKKLLRAKYEAACVESASGEATYIDVVRMTFACVDEVLRGQPWREAFRGCGFGDAQRGLGKRLRRRLQWIDSTPIAGADLPRLEELRLVWHSGREIPIGWLFNLCTAMAAPPQKSLLPPSVCEGRADSGQTLGGGVPSSRSGASSSSQAPPASSSSVGASPCPSLSPVEVAMARMAPAAPPSVAAAPLPQLPPHHRLPVGRPLLRARSRSSKELPQASPPESKL